MFWDGVFLRCVCFHVFFVEQDMFFSVICLSKGLVSASFVFLLSRSVFSRRGLFLRRCFLQEVTCF